MMVARMPHSPTGAMAPVLYTDRLVLRPHVMADFDAYAALFASPRAEHMGVLDRRGAWFSFASDVAQWALMGCGAWAVERVADGAFVGQVAINRPAHFPEPELGWMLFAPFEDAGYAYEAAQAARDFAWGTLGLAALVSYIGPDNGRSIALARRLGAVLDPQAARPEPDDLVFRHPVPDRAS